MTDYTETEHITSTTNPCGAHKPITKNPLNNILAKP